MSELEILQNRMHYQKKFGDKKEAKKIQRQIDKLRGIIKTKKIKPLDLTFDCESCGLNIFVSEPGTNYEGQKCLHYKTHLTQTTGSELYWRIKTESHLFTETPVIECDYYSFKSIPGVRVDCYLSKLSKYQRYCGDSKFEVITRQQNNHILSPSWTLLKKYKKENWDFAKYKENFLKEMENEECKKAISRLKKISKTKTVFLVCLEKNPDECHRSIIKELIEGKND